MSIAQNQLRSTYTSIIAVSASAPTVFSLGDIYYNTTTNLLYTAIKDDNDNLVWGEGESPIANHLYCDTGANVFYGVDNGILFANVGTGQVTNPLNANLDANNHKILNLADGTGAKDAVNKSQLDIKANITDVILLSEKGVANGVANLDSNGIIPTTELPLATMQEVGAVKPDGTTITIDSTGTLYASQQTFYTPPLLSFTWSDHILNQVSWLRADTFSWQDGSVYSAVYNHLASEVNPVTADLVYNPTTYSIIDQRDIYRISRISYRNSAYDCVYNGVTYYAWAYGDTLNTFGLLVDGWFTLSETPQVNDTIYVADINGITNGVSATPWTLGVSYQVYCDNIDGIHFPVYYRASDGHKICIKEEYASTLYNYNGSAWYFILDTENQRFKLPRTKYGFTGLRDAAGNYVPQEVLLPNITGDYHGAGDVVWNSQYANGAFYLGSNATRNDPDMASSHTYPRLAFDASRCSTVYSGDGTDTTIQPQATQMYLYFYVGNYIQSVVQQTAGLNTELFNNKVDLDANNLNNQGTSKIANLGMPSDTYDDLTLGASGSTYTAPADGYIMINAEQNNTNGYIILRSSISGMRTLGQPTTTNNFIIGIYLPIKKGGNFIVDYSGINVQTFRFIYAVGSEWEA